MDTPYLLSKDKWIELRNKLVLLRKFLPNDMGEYRPNAMIIELIDLMDNLPKFTILQQLLDLYNSEFSYDELGEEVEKILAQLINAMREQ